MPDSTKDQPQGNRRGRIDALWSAICGTCIVACYDFNLWKRSDPPDIDAEPVIVDLADRKERHRV